MVVKPVKKNRRKPRYRKISTGDSFPPNRLGHKYCRWRCWIGQGHVKGCDIRAATWWAHLHPTLTKLYPRTCIGAYLSGVFLASADSTMILATYDTISSDFGKLEDAVWLISSYHVGPCTAQQLVKYTLRAQSTTVELPGLYVFADSMVD